MPVAPELEEISFYGYRPHPGDIVVEVGAGAGGETDALSDLVGADGLVVAVEGHPESYLKLASRDLPENVRLVNAVALAYSGHAWMTDTGELLREHVVEKSNGVGTVRARALRLDVICRELERIDFVKVDVEGSEHKALDGFSDALDRTDNLVVSCHDFMGLPTRADVTALLENAGFRVESHPNPIDSCHADYVYARRRRRR